MSQLISGSVRPPGLDARRRDAGPNRPSVGVGARTSPCAGTLPRSGCGPCVPAPPPPPRGGNRCGSLSRGMIRPRPPSPESSSGQPCGTTAISCCWSNRRNCLSASGFPPSRVKTIGLVPLSRIRASPRISVGLQPIETYLAQTESAGGAQSLAAAGASVVEMQTAGRAWVPTCAAGRWGNRCGSRLGAVERVGELVAAFLSELMESLSPPGPRYCYPESCAPAS